MNVIAWSPNLTEDGGRIGVGYATKEELFRPPTSITIHLVLGRPLARSGRRRRSGAHEADGFLVNTARGPIVDEAAPCWNRASSRKIAGAASTCTRLNRYRSTIPSASSTHGADAAPWLRHRGHLSHHYTQMVEGIDGWFKGEPVRKLA